MAFWQVMILLSAAAVAFVIWPLLKVPFARKKWTGAHAYDETQVALYNEHLADLEKARLAGDIDDAQFQELKLDLQKTLIAEDTGVAATSAKPGGKRLVIVIAALVPICGFIFYSIGGAKADWDIYQRLEELPQATSQDDYTNRMRELVVMVQSRLQRTPENLQLRNLQAQMAMALQDYDQAVGAYRAILEQMPDQPRVMSNLAQAMFYRAGNVVTPEVREYTQKALQLAPMLPEMLGLAGIDAKNQGDYEGAVRYWKLAVSQMDPNSAVAKGYLNGIAKAEQALAAAGQPVADPPIEGAEKAGGDTAVTALVSLSEAVNADPDTTVFVYARAFNGPKMPLAIKRLQVKDLPTEVVLDESMAMAPGMTIKSFPELEIVARVSQSGSPAPQSGDWQATQGPVKLDAQTGPINLVINTQVP